MNNIRIEGYVLGRLESLQTNKGIRYEAKDGLLGPLTIIDSVGTLHELYAFDLDVSEDFILAGARLTFDILEEEVSYA